MRISFRSIRGRTLLACVFDEVAMWRDEVSAIPDLEVYRAVLPALMTTSGMFIGITTPYRKLGLLYQKHRDHFGQDGDDILVVQGASTRFNPNLTQSAIDAAIADDPEAARAEWEAEFRTDLPPSSTSKRSNLRSIMAGRWSFLPWRKCDSIRLSSIRLAGVTTRLRFASVIPLLVPATCSSPTSSAACVRLRSAGRCRRLCGAAEGVSDHHRRRR